MPERIQRKRTKGWTMPPGAIYVGRGTRWGNPFKVGDHHRLIGRPVRDRAEAVELYELHTGPMGSYELEVDEVRAELAGRDLACWCPPGEPCHADVLLRIANSEGDPDA